MSGRLVLVESNTTGTGRDFCRRARERGIDPIVLTTDAGRYAYLDDDHVARRTVDTADPIAVLATCESLYTATDHLLGVTSSSDHYIATAAATASRLGLPGPDPDAVRACRDKEQQRARLAAAGVPGPAYRCVTDADDAVSAARAIGLPVVVKPVTGSGSVGVRLCRDAGEVSSHATALLGAATDERGNPVRAAVLVEQYLPGGEFSVETFHDRVVAVVGKRLGPPPGFVETGHDVPALLAETYCVALCRVALDAVRALGLGWGPAHTELRLAPGGRVAVVEVNPRLAGGMIPDLVRLSLGVDLVAATVDAACGREPSLRRTRRDYASIRFVLAPRAGIVRSVRGVAAALATPGIVRAEVAVTAGATVTLDSSFRDRIGHVLGAGATPTAAGAADRAARLITVEVGAARPVPPPHGGTMTASDHVTSATLPRWTRRPPSAQTTGGASWTHVRAAVPAQVNAGLRAVAARTGVGVEAALATAHCVVLRALTSLPAVTTRVRTLAGSADVALTLPAASWESLLPVLGQALLAGPAATTPRCESELDLTGLAGDRAGRPATDRSDATVRVALHCLGEQLELEVAARTDQFDADWTERVCGYLLTAITQLASEPGTVPDGQSLLDAAEFDEQVTAHRGPDRPLDGLLFPAAFAQAVDTFADQPALARNGITWTYAELAGRADRIANTLREAGLDNEDVVAVLADRSLAWAAACIGVLLAGGVYLPVRPDFPASRVATQLGRSAAKFVLVDDDGEQTLRAARPDPRGLGVWHLDPDAAPTARHENHPATGVTRRASAGTDLAYIYFTSGSTGTPKGAMCEHAGLINHLYMKIDDLEIAAGDTVVQTASPCFDISLWQLLAPLVVGGRCLIIDTDDQLDVAGFVDLLSRGGVQIAQLVPSYLDILMTHVQQHPTGLGDVRRVSVTGEALKYSLVERWFTLFPTIPLVNAYGATEVSDDTMHAVLLAVPPRGSVSVGTSLRNVGTYLVDPDLRLVPSGAPGEIVFSGVCVGRGYINDPDRTAEAFTDDPFRPGERLYRTGDFGRWLPEGTIEFLGRRDEQVKVRGYRIEIGEIENRLALVPGVSGSAVVVVGEADSSRTLVAFYTGSPDLQVADLADFLAAHVPDYMVPSYFHRLDALPLTENGKVDKRALLALADDTTRSASAFAAPTTPTQRRLTTVWAEVLGLQVGRIGLDDDFFALGGTSLSAVRTVVKLDRAVTLRQLTTARTVRRLAEQIDGTSGGDTAGRRLQRLSADIRAPRATLVCFPYAAGNAVNFRGLADALGRHDIDVLGVEPPAHDIASPGEQPAGVLELARLVAAELSELRGPVLIWGHCAGAAAAVELAGLLEHAGRPSARVIIGSPPSLDAEVMAIERAAIGAATNRELTERLRSDSAYVELDLLKDERGEVVGRAYRHDVSVAHAYLLADHAPLHTRVTLVTGSDVDAHGLAARWRRLAHDVEVEQLDGDGEYFVRTAPDCAARIVLAGLPRRACGTSVAAS